MNPLGTILNTSLRFSILAGFLLTAFELQAFAGGGYVSPVVRDFIAATAGAAAPTAAAIAAQKTIPDDFKGIYVAAYLTPWTTDKNWSNTASYYYVLGSNFWNVPYIDGVFAEIGWNQIQNSKTNPTAFDWTKLDQVFDEAERYDKKVSLAFVAGVDTPDWVYSQLGATKLGFVKGFNKDTGVYDYMDIPLPWDANFLSAWGNFLNEAAKHISANPDWKNRLKIVKLSGINEYTSEVRQPDTARPGAQKPLYGDMSLWDQVWTDNKYTPSKILGAWNDILKDYDDSFYWVQHFSMQIILQGWDFPAMDENSEFVTDRLKPPVDVTHEMVLAAYDYLNNSSNNHHGDPNRHHRFSVQWDAISDQVDHGFTSATHPMEPIKDARAGILVGWQSDNWMEALWHGSLRGYPQEYYQVGHFAAGCFGGTAVAHICDENEFLNLLLVGIRYYGQFIEVFPQNVNPAIEIPQTSPPDTKYNPHNLRSTAHPCALKKAHDCLAGTGPCKAWSCKTDVAAPPGSGGSGL